MDKSALFTFYPTINQNHRDSAMKILENHQETLVPVCINNNSMVIQSDILQFLIIMVCWHISLACFEKANVLEPYEPTPFQINLNDYMIPDPEHINGSVYEALNNAPGHFVDQNGKAPLTAEEILVAKFGEERRMEYRLLDLLFNEGRFGVYNVKFVQKAKWIEKTIDKWLTGAIRHKLLPELPQPIVASSRGIQHEIQIQYRNGICKSQLLDGSMNQMVLKREASTPTLQATAAEALLQRANYAAEMYISEMDRWRNLSMRTRIYNDFTIPNGNSLNLTTAELEHLYSQNNFRYIGILRMHISSLTYFENRELLPTHDFLYRQFRQQEITLTGVDNRSITVPFRSMFEH